MYNYSKYLTFQSLPGILAQNRRVSYESYIQYVIRGNFLAMLGIAYLLSIFKWEYSPRLQRVSNIWILYDYTKWIASRKLAGEEDEKETEVPLQLVTAAVAVWLQ